MKDIINDLGMNTIYGISETRLGKLDTEKQWELDENFKVFRDDRKSSEKNRRWRWCNAFYPKIFKSQRKERFKLHNRREIRKLMD